MFNFSKKEDTLKSPQKELSDEIISFRKKNKEFQATNEHETYLIICFSCKEDKISFAKDCGVIDHTLVDGYEFAKKIGKKPVKPSFKLAKPLSIAKKH